MILEIARCFAAYVLLCFVVLAAAGTSYRLTRLNCLHSEALAAEIYRLRAERQALAARWQPIETAPKDCTSFLWCSEGVYAVIRWPEYEACFASGFWMPLPDPPTPKEKP